MKIPNLRFWQWFVLFLVLAYAVDWFIQLPDGRARQINAALASLGSEALNRYPFPFRALRVAGNTAVLTTPRNPQSPAFRFLAVIHPEVDVKDANNPAFIAVEKELAAVQSEAMRIALAQPGIKGVQWELDKTWLANHGVDVSQ